MAEKESVTEVLVAVSDLHCGSVHGLCHEDGVTMEGETYWRPGPAGIERWGYWHNFWVEVGRRVREVNGRLSVLVNGDLTEGNGFRDTEVVSKDVGLQVEICTRALEPMLDLSPHKIYVTRGTGVHVGFQAALERAVARNIGAEPDPVTRSPAAYFWLLNINGKRVYATHHPPSKGRLVRTRQSQAALAANEVASRFLELKGEDGRPVSPPDIAIFSHGHEPSDTGPVLPHRMGTRAVYLGAWQSKTQYAHKVAPVAQDCYHGAILFFHPGRQVIIEHLVYPPVKRVEEVSL